ncbi:MAG: GIY-YIG nuclease family protein [Nostoc sp.]|uniref:GIY-YIG nuclease family protein n=1 Tax=Nostoc sp. TaxID=1180 RepID=UPI002FF4A856
MSQKIWELADFNEFWKHVPTLALVNYETKTLPEVFRITLGDLNELFGSRFPIECFDYDALDKYTIATDTYSFPHLLELKDQSLYGAANEDGSGWIYIYSNIAEIGIGRCEEGYLWWKSINYNCRVKIGRTGRHLFQRLKEQADKAATALARKPVVLGAFWTPNVTNVERSIHQRLRNFKAENAGGTEWFECPSVFALKAVRHVLLESRKIQLEQTVSSDISEVLQAIAQQSQVDQATLSHLRNIVDDLEQQAY